MSTPESRRTRLVGADVSEVALPGIGQRYELRAAEGGSVTVVIHHSGRRDLYVLDDDEPRASVVLTDSQARTLGAILGGAYFKPAVVEEIEAVIGGLLIHWVTLDEDSPAAGKTIAELQIRSRTRTTVAGHPARARPLGGARADRDAPPRGPPRRHRPPGRPPRLPPPRRATVAVGETLVAVGGVGIGAIYLVLNVGGGLLLGLTLRWGTAEALVLAGAIGISSSAIVTKLLIELRPLANPESRLILGIIVVEDIFLALVLPLRDTFAAAFFFAFGLTIDPGDARDVAVPVAAAVLLSIGLNLTAGIFAARIQGFGRSAAANIGLTILGRGEFSLILATLAATAGLDGRIGPFVALYVLVLAVLGPLLAARSPILARLLPVRLFPPAPRRTPATAVAAGPDV